MPNSVTMRRASSVAFWMSSLAPVLMVPSTIVSAARPPSMTAIRSSSSSGEQVPVLSRHLHRVAECAPARGMMLTLVTGSPCGTSAATRAWPHSW